MKIDSALQQVSSLQGKGIKTRSGKDRPGSKDPVSISDNVEITDASTRMRELERQLAGQSPENVEKIASIRQAIADGHFSVDEEAVAESMVQETIEQLRHRQNR